tara:strand:+ start:243 stop:995 length:753 start_codon:yes stop_codon:yes gene_type:complete
MSNFIVNPYSFVSGAVDDTGLKAYWKFNESSGDVINVSESSVDLGSSADIQITGATYDVSESPFGYAMSFDGSNDFGVCGSSLTNFNFLHNDGATWTICFWAKLTKGSDRYISCTSEGSTGIGLKLGMNATDFRIYTQNGSDEFVANFTGTSGFIPNNTTYYFYCFRWDQDLGSNNFKAIRNDNNLEQSNKTGNSPSDSNSTDPMTFGKRPDLNVGYTQMALAEFSVWDRVLSDEEMTNLYNSGNGKAIY